MLRRTAGEDAECGPVGGAGHSLHEYVLHRPGVLRQPVRADDRALPEQHRRAQPSHLGMAQETLPAPARTTSANGSAMPGTSPATCSLRREAQCAQRRGGQRQSRSELLRSGPDKNNFFDGIDWNERKSGQPFFAHITIMETHKGGGWTLARQQPKVGTGGPGETEVERLLPRQSGGPRRVRQLPGRAAPLRRLRGPVAATSGGRGAGAQYGRRAVERSRPAVPRQAVSV